MIHAYAWLSVCVLATPAPSKPGTLQLTTTSEEHEWSFKLPETDAPSSCTVVVAAFNTSLAELAELQQRLPQRCSMRVYDKGPGAQCATDIVPSSLPCVPTSNDGLDWNPVWLRFVRENYNDLPDVLIVTPSGFAQHRRFERLAESCGGPLSDPSRQFGIGRSFCCVPREHQFSPLLDRAEAQHLSKIAHVHMRTYQDRNVTPANVRPFGPWLRSHLNWESHSDGRLLHFARQCTYSLFATTRTNLQAHPQSVYDALAEEFDGQTTLGEDAFFMEWAEEAVFGAAQLRERAEASSEQMDVHAQGPAEDEVDPLSVGSRVSSESVAR